MPISKGNGQNKTVVGIIISAGILSLLGSSVVIYLKKRLGNFLSVESNLKMVEKHGNKYFEDGAFVEAISMYTQAILLSSSDTRKAVYYCKRAECRMKLNDFTGAIEDSHRSLECDRYLTDGYLQIFISSLAMGDLSKAMTARQKCFYFKRTLGPDAIEKHDKLVELSQRIDKTRNFTDMTGAVTCLSLIEKFKKLAPYCLQYEEIRARCLAYLDRFPKAHGYYESALVQYEANSLELSISELKNCLELNPDHARAKCLLEKVNLLKNKKEQGNNYFKNQNYQEALECYNAALQVDPSNKAMSSILHYNRGQTYAKLGNSFKAIRDYDTAISLNQYYFNALFQRAKANFEIEEYKKCITDCDKLLENHSSHSFTAQARTLKQDSLAHLEWFKKADDHFESGSNFYAEGDLDESINQLTLCLKLVSDHEQGVPLLETAKRLKNKLDQGKNYFKAEKYHDAWGCYTEALSVDPQNKNVNCIFYYNRGLTNDKLGNLTQAIKDYDFALSLNEKYHPAVLKRAQIFFEIEEYGKCIQDCEWLLNNRLYSLESKKLKENCNKKRDEYYRKANGSYYYDGNLDETIKNLKVYLTFNPNHVQAKKTLENAKLLKTKKDKGNNSFKSGRYLEALKIYKEALKIDPSSKAINSILYYNCGLANDKLNNLEDAVKDCTEALKLNREYFKAVYKRASLFFDLKKYPDCLKDCETAIKLNPSSFEPKTLKAKCLKIIEAEKTAEDHFKSALSAYNNGNLEDCIKKLNLVLQHKPKHEKAKYFLDKSKLLKQNMDKAKNLHSLGKYQDALNILNETLDIDPKNKIIMNKLFYHRALANQKLGKINDAINDCSEALKLNPKHFDAIYTRAQAYFDLDEHEKCISDCEIALKIKKSAEVEQLLKNAEKKLQEEKEFDVTETDAYKILAVKKDASLNEIKKAYNALALKYHPDKHPNVSEKKKKLIENKMKQINDAYAKLAKKDYKKK